MHRGKRRFWALLGLGACVSLLGCVTTSSPAVDMRSPRSDGFARAPDVPLVPVPPPPLGKEEKDGAPPAAKPASPPTSSPPAAGAPAGESSAITASAPPTPVRPGAIAPVPKAVVTAVTARQLHRIASDRYTEIDSYIVRLVRREQIKDKLNPEEVLLFKFRKAPWSVSLKWLGKEGQGREVVYVRGRYEGKIHTLLAAGDIPFVPAGRRMALLPDSLLVRNACRHPITEAGIGASIERLGILLAANEGGDRRQGSLAVLSAVRRPEFDVPVNALENTIPADVDSSLPKGGKRTYYFDPASGLPTLITAVDPRGQLVEYYRYDRLLHPVKLDDNDFDPDVLWSKPRAAATLGAESARLSF